ncbi:MAG: hypothetical protein V1658_02245, partial [Candidatus Micrarchaeota archaeon]
IVSKDIAIYGENLTSELEKMGTLENDGNYVLRGINPPYRDLKTGEIKGLVSAIYIKGGERCPECFNTTGYVEFISSNGIYTDSAYYYDFDSKPGMNITNMYNLSWAPTFLLSPEIKEYPVFMQNYRKIGFFADDGWFVFTNIGLLPDGAKYFDIRANATAEITLQQ